MLGSQYELFEVIGRGATGTVRRASVRGGGPPLAAKLLREDLAADPAVRARFLQESVVLQGLLHPALVTVHDVVSDGGHLALGLAIDAVRTWGGAHGYVYIVHSEADARRIVDEHLHGPGSREDLPPPQRELFRSVDSGAAEAAGGTPDAPITGLPYDVSADAEASADLSVTVDRDLATGGSVVSVSREVVTDISGGAEWLNTEVRGSATGIGSEAVSLVLSPDGTPEAIMRTTTNQWTDDSDIGPRDLPLSAEETVRDEAGTLVQRTTTVQLQDPIAVEAARQAVRAAGEGDTGEALEGLILLLSRVDQDVTTLEEQYAVDREVTERGVGVSGLPGDPGYDESMTSQRMTRVP
jgi:hypothetical protein